MIHILSHKQSIISRGFLSHTLLDLHHHPLIREHALAAVSLLTSSSVVSRKTVFEQAYGGVTILIKACRSGSEEVQEHIAGAISNISAVEEIRTTLAEEGAVPVLLPLLISGSSLVKEKTVNFISLISSSGEYFRDLIVRERGLQIRR
ncbi:hypothetical protein ARALYDRAFT_917837 [Arabidopsis lyrata subsp. lyrata]|uniref:Armadillo/beta-catenin repeat family protein n=1 Tax=Arabidopsis lyrata subsp. lyrata TaxID=81972 RepID=D7MMQ3_ARALL|nr:hypothetical protein ARALYDRAFT_917837 [Arabidopsis lyrata subsp. lyrata]